MAEYSKLAQGSFACTAQQQVVYLPFVPDYVRVVGLSGLNNVTPNNVNSIEWASCMNQGDGILYKQGTGGFLMPVSVATQGGSGISTFSAGLSFNFGAQLAINSITKASPAVVTTAAAHGYSTGDIVLFENTVGMQQIAGIPFAITVTGTSTFTIPWNTNQTSYTAISGSPSGALVKKVNYPFLYAPGVSIISAIGLGTTTTITTTTPHNLVVGQEVAFRIPTLWGTVQLNSLPNTQGIPGSPMYGYVTVVNSSVQVTVNINSSLYSAYTNNMPTTSVSGLSSPQMVAVGDVNNGGVPYSGSALYPSPVVNGVSTINGPAILGSFVNNTRQGFVIGSAFLTTGDVGTCTFFWQASAHDYLAYSSVGVAVS